MKRNLTRDVGVGPRAAVRAAVRWRGAPDPEAAQAPSGWVHAIAHCGDYGAIPPPLPSPCMY